MDLLGITIWSGGQTGADRAGLDWAIQHRIAHAGWCPKGRLAEDGPIPAVYQLKETPRKDYLQRTEWNVRDTDATLIFTMDARLSGGSLRTFEFARRQGKPVVHLSANLGVVAAADSVHRCFAEHPVRILNIAGSRASKEPEVGRFVVAVLDYLLAHTG